MKHQKKIIILITIVIIFIAYIFINTSSEANRQYLKTVFKSFFSAESGADFEKKTKTCEN